MYSFWFWQLNEVEFGIYKYINRHLKLAAFHQKIYQAETEEYISLHRNFHKLNTKFYRPHMLRLHRK
ncbi:hypothetical protein MPQ_0155 [Methylovorus sp. MP688]|nr:hypothetical protein MPQ_0155 [Methylovorus sp. MP688]